MTAHGTVFRILHTGYKYPEYLVSNDDPKDAEKQFRLHNQLSDIISIERVGFGHIVMLEVDER